MSANVSRKDATTTDALAIKASVLTPKVVKMTVMSDLTRFNNHVSAMYRAMEIEVSAHKLKMPFSVEELTKYLLTAVRTRVYRVSAQYVSLARDFHIRCNSEWYLPTKFAAIVNALGVFESTVPNAIYVPVWFESHNDKTFTKPEEILEISMGLRSLEGVTSLRFSRGILSTLSGDEAVMTVIPLRNADGQIDEVRSHKPIHGIQAVTVVVTGMVHGFYSQLEDEMVREFTALSAPWHFTQEQLSYMATRASWDVA